MQRILKKIMDYTKILFQGVSLIWKCSHKLTVLFIVSNIILGLCNPFLMVIWKYFIDAATNAIFLDTKELVIKSVTVLIFHCLVIIIMDFINQVAVYMQESQRDHLNKYILNLTMQKISELDMVHFDNPEIYDKIEKVNNESTQRTVSLLSLIVVFVRTSTNLIGTIIILGKINLFFVILCFMSCIPIFVVNTKISLKKYSLFNSRMEKMRLVYALKYLLSKYENIKEIKIFRLGKYIKNMAIDVYSKNIKEDTIVRKKYLCGITLSDALQNIISYVFKLYILLKVLLGKIYTLGDLTMFISAIESFQTGSQNLFKTASDLYIDGLYLQNLFSLINIKIEKKGELNFDRNFREIIFEDVWFKYPGSDKYILEGIDCRFKAGKSYSLLGLNGSGKTTIIKLLTKLYEPTKGRILVDNIDLRDINSESYYENIGVIFQDFVRYPFNVVKNIGVGKIEEVNNLDLIKHVAGLTEANKFIEQLPNSYNTLLQKEWSDGTELSLGQWQKIAISRAYMSNSPIVILDEPTASLDAEAELQVYKQFKSLMEHKLCVLISHRLSANKLVEYIYYLENGKIIEEGSHVDLMKANGKYKAYYNKQASYYLSNGGEKDD